MAALRIYKPELMKKYPIAALALFGSYARNEATEDSDIDVMVEFNGRIGLGFVQMALDLEDVFQNRVDLVSKNSINDRYMKYIAPDLIYV